MAIRAGAFARLFAIVGMRGQGAYKRSANAVKNDTISLAESMDRLALSQHSIIRRTGQLIGGWLGFRAVLGGARALLDVNVAAEVMNAQLETLEGSTQGASDQFERMVELAKSTPFEVENLTRTLIRLRSIGLEGSNEEMTRYGDIAAAWGRDITEVAEAIGGAVTGEFERLKRFGIATSKNGDQISFTYKGITETIGGSTEEIAGYMRRLSDENFTGAMIRQMDRLPGRLSNLKDAFDAWLRRVGDEGFNEGMGDTATMLIEIIDSGDEFATRTGRNLARLFRQLGRLAEWVGRNFEVIQSFAIGLGSFFVLASLLKFMGALNTIAMLISGVAGAMQLARFIFAIPFALGLLALQDFYIFLKGGDSIIGRWAAHFSGRDGLEGKIAQTFLDIRDHGKDALSLMGDDFLAFAANVQALAPEQGRGFVRSLFDGVFEALKDEMDDLRQIWRRPFSRENQQQVMEDRGNRGLLDFAGPRTGDVDQHGRLLPERFRRRQVDLTRASNRAFGDLRDIGRTRSVFERENFDPNLGVGARELSPLRRDRLLEMRIGIGPTSSELDRENARIRAERVVTRMVNLGPFEMNVSANGVVSSPEELEAVIDRAGNGLISRITTSLDAEFSGGEE